MKNSQNGFVRVLLLIIGIIIILIVGGAVTYAKNPEVIINLVPVNFLSPEARAQREYKKILKIFPETIGNYYLYRFRNEQPLQVREKCENVESHPDTKNLGITGEVCQLSISAQYRTTDTDQMIFVNIGKTTKGEGVVKQLLQKLAKKDTLYGYNVIRVESHEIGWFPSSDFEFILTQEGRHTTTPEGGESYNYNKATGNNPVIKYFIEKYPPVK